MSDQSLREELKELRLYCGKFVDDPDASEDEQIAYDDVCIRLAGVLAAHPAEPAPVVTDEAVQDLHAGVVTQFRRHGQYTLADARAALEAAAPLLGPRPLLDREAVYDAVVEVRDAAPRLPNDADSYDIVDAVMELARPMPTRKKVFRALYDEAAWCGNCEYDGVCDGCQHFLGKYTDALLALLNGVKS